MLNALMDVVGALFKISQSVITISIFYFCLQWGKQSSYKNRIKCPKHKIVDSPKIESIDADCANEINKIQEAFCYAQSHSKKSFLHTYDYSTDENSLHGAINEVFSQLHHPDSVPSELIYNQHKLVDESNPYKSCKSN
jgi:hypothetical protein